MTTADDRKQALQPDSAVNDGAMEPVAEFDTDTLVEPDSGDLPQEITESYGTGVHDQPGFATGGNTLRDRINDFNEASPTLTGGDIDANYEQANAVGDESVGGTVATPGMDVVDELGAAVGLEMNERSFLRTNDVLEERDARRWELEPTSSEDYADRADY